jgi:hypothetical protein
MSAGTRPEGRGVARDLSREPTDRASGGSVARVRERFRDELVRPEAVRVVVHVRRKHQLVGLRSLL